MNRQRADRVVGLLVTAVLAFGGLLAWQAYRQNRAMARAMGSMMGSSPGAIHGTDPLWYVVGTLLVAVVVGGLYLAVRDDLPPAGTAGSIQRPVGDEREAASPGTTESGPRTAAPSTDESGGRSARNPEADPTRRVLDLLPEDERRVLEPVIDSPGITQIELRDRSDFSKSKVSQTVSGLEKRGLLYRERQGRTYRVYPSDDLREST